ncbi:MAG: NifB/NifX family molybdenum-iron cluster-binding protein [Chloroflexota bacterium]
MKIVLTAAAPTLEAAADPRFGRAAYLLVVDSETNACEAYPNIAIHASGGAGIQAAQFIAGLGVQAAISGDFGPNAFDALQAAEIAMYLYGDCQRVPQALERFKAGQLQQAGTATRDGHHGRSA